MDASAHMTVDRNDAWETSGIAANRTHVSSTHQEIFFARARETLAYALQPIVNIHTGSVYGHEALLRGVTELGFLDVFGLLDHAWNHGFAGALDSLLRDLAIARFAQLPNAGRYRLFFNLDPRLLDLDRPEITSELLRRHGLGSETICLELSENASLTASPQVAELIDAYRRHRFHLAIDDFGSGYAGLRLLYEHPPDLLKIDRFFISGIADDHRKGLFVANTVQLAHVMGISVVAEGVETEAEFLACKDAGCDLVQGYLIARPQLDIDALRPSYEQVIEINRRDRRESHGDLALIQNGLERIPPLSVSASVKAMFEAFRLTKVHQVIPVLDGAERPLGLIHEVDIKEYIYSIYGRELIVNPAFSRSLRDFARPCPAVDTHVSAERLLEAFSAAINPAGLIVTQDDRYLGFISATSLLQLVEQKNLAAARDQNPLSKLPGNIPIHEYVSRILDERDSTWHLVYFDFDNFKAFNDHYGFRLGDRAILMFAELLQKHLGTGAWFIGHIGGDDFFAGTQNAPTHQVIGQMRDLLGKFGADVQSLYDPEDRRRGHLRARDRFGEERDMPLMRCSAAVIEIRPGEDFVSVDSLSRIIAAMKHQAKASSSGLVFRHDPDPRGSALTLPEESPPPPGMSQNRQTLSVK
ncbi:GGDEF domain-containing protein [Thiocystis violascens]|uniref:Diguanylate cyclase (GGDEF) domain-containing protein n=1 Tax=Thiocystis violascens (strain ATCC 17096 / DSM 198 / 6111) TaxID=765911 RepID=I3Y6H1_THIV6|nr:GGDEF domain-containing protein [Thiocystis violascens]AFL72589.1 diguanylate cyclase (GGDEF) domain-containing protein [Thiocystis violascens DSM 198]